ncbi:MAG: tyrosine--tRNA ligase [Bacteroidota bacterium]
MDFLQELEWRNMLHQQTPGLNEELAKGKAVGYIGFDPTAPSMTIGNFVQLQLLRLFQNSGHQPIVLMGGATGRIGDPSGKDAERQLKSYEELDYNLEHQAKQARKFLNFDEGPNKALLVNNLDFYKEMNVLSFLRDVGKTLTVNYMSSKESVKKRIETGISFTEFSYQLLQAYDYQCLYKQYGCRVQMGGSDQWGNITSGTEFIRRNLNGKAHAVTTPLLTKADGSKFGKSEAGNIWLDPKMTSPYDFYQFWVRAKEEDLPAMMRYFTLKSKEEVEAIESQYAEQPKQVSEILAEELTVRVHSKEALEAARLVSKLLFSKANKETLLSLDVDSLKTVAKEIKSYQLDRSLIEQGVNIDVLMTEHTDILASKGDVRRAIKNNAIAVNKDKVGSHDALVNHEQLLHGKYIMIENGRKNKFILIVE